MPKQKNQSDDLFIMTRCCDLKTIAKMAGIDIRTARRIAVQTGSLLKLGTSQNSKVLVIRERFWDGLCSMYRVDE